MALDGLVQQRGVHLLLTVHNEPNKIHCTNFTVIQYMHATIQVSAGNSLTKYCCYLLKNAVERLKNVTASVITEDILMNGKQTISLHYSTTQRFNIQVMPLDLDLFIQYSVARTSDSPLFPLLVQCLETDILPCCVHCFDVSPDGILPGNMWSTSVSISRGIQHNAYLALLQSSRHCT